MGKEFKHINIEISYTRYAKNSEVTVTRKAEVSFGAETTFAEIEGFLEDCKKVIQGFKYCAKNGNACKVYLSSSVFDNPGGVVNMKSVSFNGWQFEGVPDCGDAEGLYLSPDTRYTDECHDIWIDFAEPLLGQLAQANI